jgi:RHS repeat-associated protein
MKQIELIEKRKAREKHFLQEDGSIIAYVYNNDVHYLKDGKYIEIDNSLITSNNKIINKSNKYHVSFNRELISEIFNFEIDGHQFKLFIDNGAKNVVSKAKILNDIMYKNAFPNSDLIYSISTDKIKESIILKNKQCINNEYRFMVESDLCMEISNEGDIVVSNNRKKIFNINKLFVFDKNNISCDNVKYKLNKTANGYLISLILDIDWLKNAIFPVTIDPTISIDNNSSLQCTYICNQNVNRNYSTSDELRVGIDGLGYNNMALLKFDLPELGTGSQIIDARLDLVGFPMQGFSYFYDPDIMTIHRINDDWEEASATWSNMINKYDSYVEACFEGRRTFYQDVNDIQSTISSAEITNLVKKWYTNVTNNGLLIKAYRNVYNGNFVPSFCSKNYSNNTNPMLLIRYRNTNGLEDYLKYLKHEFSCGSSNININNGNLTSSFNVGKIISKKIPVNLEINYNTNDVVLNHNYGYGKGWKLNLHQTIKYEQSNDIFELEDGDGTTHYFNPYKKIASDIEENEEFDESYEYIDGKKVATITETGKYFDEDGLGLTLTLISNTHYKITDKNNNSKIFEIVNQNARLVGIEDSYQNSISILYDNNNRIIEIVSNDGEIDITYGTNVIQIYSSCSDSYTSLTYNNNLLENINNSLGNIVFNYNNDCLISFITDITGLKEKYEYYDKSPYRIKKNTTIGYNGGIGNSLFFIYDFLSTTLISNDNKRITYTFNQYGNICSAVNYKDENYLSDAVGITLNNGDFQERNHLLSNGAPQKHVKNLLENSSFEDSNNHGFIAGYGIDSIGISTDTARTGKKSLKIVTSSVSSIYKNVNVKKGKTYTFSGYFKNDFDIILSLSYDNYINSDNENSARVIKYNDNFNRYDVSIYYPEDGNGDYGDLSINIAFNSAGDCVYIDDIQLEESDVCSPYNLLENSDFTNGFNGWHRRGIYNEYDVEIPNDDNYDIVTLPDGTKACKIIMEPDVITGLSRTFNISGNSGDLYTISFWYKNEAPDDNINYNYNSVLVNYIAPEMVYDEDLGEYVLENLPHCAIPSTNLNHNDTEWQFFSEDFIAENNFEEIELSIFQQFKANNLYVTNFCLYKDEGKYHYQYDENGNLVSCSDSSNTSEKYEYDEKNQLTKISPDLSNAIFFEYDNNQNNKLLMGITNNGMCNKYVYDLNNNITAKKIMHYNSLENNGQYKIRLKSSDKYIELVNKSLVLSEDSHDKWLFIQQGDYYKIKHNILKNFYVFNDDNNLCAGLLDNISNNRELFKLIKNNNGTYYIQSKSNDLYVKKNLNSLVLSDFDEESSNDYQFYLETEYNKFIECNSNYNSVNNYMTDSIDSSLNNKQFLYNSENGLISREISSNGNIIDYTYDSRNNLIRVNSNDNEIIYTYNSRNLLSTINVGNKTYEFEYDEFLNKTAIKVNGSNLISYSYDSKGNRTLARYGNGDEIQYVYDDFDRIKKIIMSDDTINYYYDVNGNIEKVISSEYREKYNYDLKKRLHSYESLDENFAIKYNYDDEDRIVSTEYAIINDNTINTSTNAYNDNGNLIESNIGGNLINYTYDEIGRVESRTINNNIQTTYDYISNGKRNTSIVKSITNNGNSFKYKYGKSNNITHVYLNGNIQKQYTYDKNNALIKEDDYTNNLTIRYKYDDYGNILSRKKFDLNTYNLKARDIYEYGDTNFKDLLTKFNNETIQYDQIGNPLVIGTKQLSWKDGRYLASVNDTNLSCNYYYNNNGLRNKKIVNNNITDYFYENNKIIFEKKDDKTINYMYNENDGIIGFNITDDQYNTYNYFYIKNGEDDVIGIVDDNNALVCKYEYDTFGNILSICDGDGYIINNSNHVAYLNPIRYRSYYYDEETGLYYLNSRYYNPTWGRFLNADGVINGNEDLIGYNLFQYTSNRYVGNADYDGKFVLSLTTAGLIFGGCLLAAGLWYYSKPKTVSIPVPSISVSKVIEDLLDKTTIKNKEGGKKPDEKRNQTVYVLVDRRGGADKVEYVGRTTNVSSRETQHRTNITRAHLKLEVVHDNLTYAEARGLEEVLIIAYKTLNKLNPTNNQIHGIRWDNPNYEFYIRAAEHLMGGETYVGN